MPAAFHSKNAFVLSDSVDGDGDVSCISRQNQTGGTNVGLLGCEVVFEEFIWEGLVVDLFPEAGDE